MEEGDEPGESVETAKKEQTITTTHPVQQIVAPARTIKLYLAEEQQILREVYQSYFDLHPTIDLVGYSADSDAASLVEATTEFNPDILLLGVKTLQPATVEKLELIREAAPDAGIVLLTSLYDVQGVKALREFSRDASAGCAYMLKHTIDTMDQLAQIIWGVVEGRIIVGPPLMDVLMNTGEGNSSLLNELSPRELEVLGWMAKGLVRGLL